MSTRVVYWLSVRSLTGEWVSVGPAFKNCFPFMYESTFREAEEHYKRLGLKTKVEEKPMEFDDR